MLHKRRTCNRNSSCILHLQPKMDIRRHCLCSLKESIDNICCINFCIKGSVYFPFGFTLVIFESCHTSLSATATFATALTVRFHPVWISYTFALFSPYLALWIGILAISRCSIPTFSDSSPCY